MRLGLRPGAFCGTLLRRNRRPRSPTATPRMSLREDQDSAQFGLDGQYHAPLPLRIAAALLVCLFGSLVGCSPEPAIRAPAEDSDLCPTGAPSTAGSGRRAVGGGVRALRRPAVAHALPQVLRRCDRRCSDVVESGQGLHDKGWASNPTCCCIYTAWGDGFDARGVRNARDIGALPVMAWEPFEPSMADIAEGASDDYITKFAAAVQSLNLPIAISLAHEMNGFWYPWGTRKDIPGRLRACLAARPRHLSRCGGNQCDLGLEPERHQPYATGPRSSPCIPATHTSTGSAWSATTRQAERSTFSTLFGPTKATVREFTRKPILILETGAEDGRRKRRDIADLFRGVAAAPDVIGFNWFNYAKRADWRIDSDPSALAQFRKCAKNDRFGFDLNSSR